MYKEVRTVVVVVVVVEEDVWVRFEVVASIVVGIQERLL
jgi:hypothetical protein